MSSRIVLKSFDSLISFSVIFACFIAFSPFNYNYSWWFSVFLHFLFFLHVLTHLRLDFFVFGSTVECLFCNLVLMSFLLFACFQSTSNFIYCKLYIDEVFSVLIGWTGRGFLLSLTVWVRGGGTWVTDQTLFNSDYCWNKEIFNTYLNMKNNAHSSFKYLCGRSHLVFLFFPLSNSFRSEVSDVLFRLVIGWLGSKLKNSFWRVDAVNEWMNWSPSKKWAVTAEHSRQPNWVKQDLVAARWRC